MSDYDRLKGALVQFIRQVLAKVDYFAIYSGTVVGQNSDGTLEITCDTPQFSGWSNVPLRLGIPGCTATVPNGVHVLVGFENGDPRRFFASLWRSDPSITLSITSTQTINVNAPSVVLAGGKSQVARTGDTVQVGSKVIPTVCLITFTSAPSPGPNPATIQFPVNPLVGAITSGSTKVVVG